MDAVHEQLITLAGRVERGPGTAGRLIIEAAIADGAHIEAHEPPDPFAIPTVLELQADDGVLIGPIEYPEPSEIRLSWSPAPLHVLKGHIRFEAPLQFQGPEGQGPSITAHLRYQACIDGACLPPVTREITVDTTSIVRLAS